MGQRPAWADGMLDKPRNLRPGESISPPLADSLDSMLRSGNVPVDHGYVTVGIGKVINTISEEEAELLRSSTPPAELEGAIQARLGNGRRIAAGSPRTSILRPSFRRGDSVRFEGKRATIIKTDVGVSGSGKIKHRIMFAGSSKHMDVKENKLTKL